MNSFTFYGAGTGKSKPSVRHSRTRVIGTMSYDPDTIEKLRRKADELFCPIVASRLDKKDNHLCALRASVVNQEFFCQKKHEY